MSLDDEYRVEVLVTVSGYVTAWETQVNNLTLKQAEIKRRWFESRGKLARIRHASEY